MNDKALIIILTVIAIELALIIFGIFIIIQVICWLDGVTEPLGMPFFFW